MDPDGRLDELEHSYYGSEGEAMAALALAVDAINGELAKKPDEGRIRELVKRLCDAARKVADEFDARGFSVSVGFPLSVGVSVDWEIG